MEKTYRVERRPAKGLSSALVGVFMPTTNFKKFFRYFLGVAPFLLVICVSIFFYIYVTPEELISFVGVQNAYILMFSVAFVGGLTTFNGIPYYSLLILLASGGLSPLLLGIVSGVGVMLGDSTSYYVGYQGAAIIPKSLKGFFETVGDIMKKYPRAFPLFCFLYGCISPFSNDFITVPAGIARYPFFQVMVPLAIGNLISNIGLAYAGAYFYDSIRPLFAFRFSV